MIGDAGDHFEREADDIASRMMRTHARVHASPTMEPQLQRLPKPGASVPAVTHAPQPAGNALLRGGSPLAADAQAHFGPRLGTDLSGVRVHTGPEAEVWNQNLSAKAFTYGNHIWFGKGQPAGINWLTAHELAHVVQQTGGINSPIVQRKSAEKQEEECKPYIKRGDPCTKWSSHELINKLPKYSRFEDESGSPGFHALSAVILTPLEVVERARLLRVACCMLEPEDARLVKEVFIARRAKAGATFHKLATATQCDLIAILNDRASRTGRATAAQIRKNLEQEQRYQQRVRQQEIERQKREEAQFAQDLELHKKAGRTTWFDVVFPSMAEVYRIPYADRIHNPVLRESARLAERAATVSVIGAAADPITRPIKAVVRFFECMISAIKGSDVRALINRFGGLKFAAAFTVSFGPGVIAGATKEIGSIAKQIASIIAHPIKFIEDLWDFLKLLWSPNSDEIACAMGEDMGEMASKDIASLANEGDVELAFDLGQIAGPLVLNTLIALVAPEIVAALKATRIGKRLLSLLETMGSELKFLDKWRKRNKSAVRIEKDVVKAERVEEAVADAAKYMTEHKVGAVEEAADGLRHARVGDHEVVEVLDSDLPTGIACELHSPKPHNRVPCPPNMGSRKETLDEFKARGGKGTDVAPGPAPKTTEAEKMAVSSGKLPERHADMPDPTAKTAKQAGVGLAEDHHIASKYIRENKALFKQLNMSIDDDLNLIADFEDHGQLRGWYDWKNRTFSKFQMKGHHPEYNQWVTKLLKEAVPKGLAPDQAVGRVTKVLQELQRLVRENPELLSHGPSISKKFLDLKFTFD